MICDFTNLKNNLYICQQCGRITKVNKNEKFFPVSKCRVPEYANITSGYVNNQKLKGVGDTISYIIKSMGYNYSPLSTARNKITYLNKKGIDWCEKNQSLIVQWMKEECIFYKVPFLDLVCKSIVRLAIRKAKKQTINL